MASKKSYQWLGVGGAERVNPINSTTEFELDESDIWGTNNTEFPQEMKRVTSHSKPLKKPLIKRTSTHIDHAHHRPIAATSLPVNVPDWSKILGKDHRGWMIDKDDDIGFEKDDDEEENDKDDRIPPHVYLARTRGASFSVHEGLGRTLKGRDLSMVRNAIWKKTGFED